MDFDWITIVIGFIDNKTLCSLSMTNKDMYRRSYKELCYRKTIYTFDYFLTSSSISYKNELKAHPYFYKKYDYYINTYNDDKRDDNRNDDDDDDDDDDEEEMTLHDKYARMILRNEWNIFEKLTIDDIETFFYIEKNKRIVDKFFYRKKHGYHTYNISNFSLLYAFIVADKLDCVKWCLKNLEYEHHYFERTLWKPILNCAKYGHYHIIKWIIETNFLNSENGFYGSFYIEMIFINAFKNNHEKIYKFIYEQKILDDKFINNFLFKRDVYMAFIHDYSKFIWFFENMVIDIDFNVKEFFLLISNLYVSYDFQIYHEKPRTGEILSYSEISEREMLKEKSDKLIEKNIGCFKIMNYLMNKYGDKLFK